MLAATVQHKYTGEQITFIETAAATNGEHLLIEVTLPPLGEGPPLHCHDEFVEKFIVLEGILTVTVGERNYILGKGQSITADKGIAHTFNNNHHEDVRFQVKLTPPSQFEESVRIHYGLMDDGLTNEQGVPKSLFHLALILKLQNTLIAGKSLRVQRGLFSALVGIGRLLNKYRNLEKYIGQKI
ncbi:cupin domain-containing protein [Metasolibacillus sp.]|uniref:cupin domain-containing protein n=1 Tax=Metasolibacillus sp. TaxID=2703680 RepID=UPI0025FAE1AD|nr:cupin domain-containing protein [Metasolibacillus sp.]MCT6923475.1 cupin domain-containing protein [Metasolibacillus sp.]MCT6939803.1 cupin domain-containing protein [Metasolibacillus sp.]